MAAGYVSIGERIGIQRRRRGLSQAAVAERLGKSAQWLSNIERGKRTADRYSVLVPIADMLRVSVAELTGDRPSASVVPDVHSASAQAVRLALSGYGFVGALDGSSEAIDLDVLADRVRNAWALVHEAR